MLTPLKLRERRGDFRGERFPGHQIDLQMQFAQLRGRGRPKLDTETIGLLKTHYDEIDGIRAQAQQAAIREYHVFLAEVGSPEPHG